MFHLNQIGQPLMRTISLERSFTASSHMSGMSARSSSSVSSNNFLNEHIGPPSMIKHAGNQVIRTHSLPVTFGPGQSASVANQQMAVNQNIKKEFQLGNYTFFEPQTANDTFSNAFNTKLNKFFYWKVRYKVYV